MDGRDAVADQRRGGVVELAHPGGPPQLELLADMAVELHRHPGQGLGVHHESGAMALAGPLTQGPAHRVRPTHERARYGVGERFGQVAHRLGSPLSGERGDEAGGDRPALDFEGREPRCGEVPIDDVTVGRVLRSV